MPSEPVPYLPPDKLPPPVRMTGIGNGHITITTAHSEAQAWFDQGLNLEHDFWDYEAARAFEQAIRVDPNCAMCWWGLSGQIGARMAGEKDSPQKDALDRARKLSKHSSRAEKLYIKAALQDFSNKKGPKGSPEKHKDSDATKTLRKLVALNPSEIQPRIFLAESLRDGFTKGEPNAGTLEAQHILEQIIREHPDDTASLHYWIHIIEPGNHPELARDAAVRLGTLTPASGHMVHMPGHIFYLLGEYDQAQSSFTRSTEVDEAYMKEQNVSPDDDWNYIHNLMYSIANLMEAGHFAAADELAKRTVTAHGTRPEVLYVGVPRDGMARLAPALPSAIRSANWAVAIELLKDSHAPEIFPNLGALRRGLLAYVEGMHALDAGNVKDASTHADALSKVVTELGGKGASMSMPGMKHDPRDAMHKPIHTYLELASQELKASLEQARGDSATADNDFKKALETENALTYWEPPNYIRPVEEAQGDALYRAKRYAEAKVAYAVAQHKRPNSGFPLYGMARCDEAMQSADTVAAYRAFLKAWHGADAALPQVLHAQQWVQQHATPAEGE